MKCQVVLVIGSLLVIEPYLGTIDALAVAWLPGTEGQGVADVLFGDHPSNGPLPRTWVESMAQLPMIAATTNMTLSSHLDTESKPKSRTKFIYHVYKRPRDGKTVLPTTMQCRV
ncbi:unnamed protein product, partial [Brassica rapa]